MYTLDQLPMLDLAAETMPTPAKRVCRETNDETEITSIEVTAENGSLSHNNNNDDKSRKIIKNGLKSGKTYSFYICKH